MTTKSFLPLLILFLHLNAMGQTDIENLERYWDYRERLVTQFMKVDADQGGSIPMNGLQRKNPVGHPLHWATDTWNGDFLGAGDGTVYLGHYLCVLATEYELLKNAIRAPLAPKGVSAHKKNKN